MGCLARVLQQVQRTVATVAVQYDIAIGWFIIVASVDLSVIFLFSNSNLRKLGWSTGNLVENSREFASSLGLDDIPALQKKTIGKMGLSVSVCQYCFVVMRLCMFNIFIVLFLGCSWFEGDERC